VLGIPRDGDIIADIVVEKLNADFYFDIVIARKLRAHDNKENALVLCRRMALSFT
jgi:predicted phosphoribosyltransferase